MASPHPSRELSLFDGICLIMGIMVGVGIFESSPTVAQYSTGPYALIGIWALGGLLSLLGAFCYAGLAQAYPESGGDYVFLNRAFGPRLGFVYAWAMLTVVRPGNMGAMAYVFARYANSVWPLPHGLFVYACGCLIALSFINLLGTRQGKGIQNVLTVGKLLGIVFLLCLALGPSAEPPAIATVTTPSFTMALIFVLFAYGGWNEIAFVAAEVKNPQRNLFWALVLGTGGVCITYLLITGAFLHAIGFEGLQHSDAVAQAIASKQWPEWGRFFVHALIAVSALGVIHGMLFSGARIYYAMGQDHPLFSPLGEWSERGTPLWSILVETVSTLLLMALFSRSPNGFESFVLYTTPLFWIFTALVSLSVFWLLPKSSGQRPLGYPLTPILFFVTCLFMLAMSIGYAYQHVSQEVFWSLGMLLLGLGLERVETWRKRGKNP